MSVTTRGRPEPLQSKLLLSYSSATCHRLWVEVLKSKANTQEVCLLHWMDQRRISAIWHWRQSGQKFLWSLQRELNRPSSVLAFFSYICVLNFNTAVKEIKKKTKLKKTPISFANWAFKCQRQRKVWGGDEFAVGSDCVRQPMTSLLVLSPSQFSRAGLRRWQIPFQNSQAALYIDVSRTKALHKISSPRQAAFDVL